MKGNNFSRSLINNYQNPVNFIHFRQLNYVYRTLCDRYACITVIIQQQRVVVYVNEQQIKDYKNNTVEDETMYCIV